MTYLKSVAIGIDQLLNTVLGGYPDETLSARSYRKQDAWYYIINKIFFWQKDHCRESWESEVNRSQLPKDRTYGN